MSDLVPADRIEQIVGVESDLLGAPEGRRVERTEWGLRQTVGNYLMRKGQVDILLSEDDARTHVGNLYYGWRDTEVVRRTVVTYTTDWEPA